MKRAGRSTMLVAAVILSGCGAPREQAPSIGREVPAFAAATLAGDTLRLSELKGEVLLLNIWATWCPPCREEMPQLQALQTDFGAQGLRVIGVSIDATSSDAEVRDFLGRNDISFTILRDPEERVTRAFRTTGVPETFLIGRDGVLRQRWIGSIGGQAAAVHAAVANALGSSAEPQG